MAVAGKIGAIVQARMGSRRLPGKVLRPLSGKPLLQYVLERVSRCPRIDSIVVCTSTEPDDDPIEAFCKAHGILTFRGDHHNVAKRFLETLARFRFDHFVRVCGDSPLIDPGLIDKCLEIYKTGWKTGSTLGWETGSAPGRKTRSTPGWETGSARGRNTGSAQRYEIVTNCLCGADLPVACGTDSPVACGTDFPVGRRAFPSGQSVEVFSAETYCRGFARMRTPEHFEHVTRFFYEHAADFRIFKLTSDCEVEQVREGILAPAGGPAFECVHRQAGKPVPHPKLSVDTQDDFDRIAEVIGRMDRPHWEYNWREIVDDLCAVSL